MTIDNLPSAMAHIQGGKLLALGVTTLQKVPSLPNVPTIASVVPGYEAASWFVVVAPAATPPAIARKLSVEIDKLLKKPVVIERFKTLGAEPVGGTPEAFGALIAKEIAEWRDLGRSAKITLD